MKKIIDKRIVVINLILLGLGFVGGVLFLIFTTGLDKLIIKEEISEFFSLIETGDSTSIGSLFISFKYNFMYIFIITVTSIVYLFSPVILLVNCYKGFLLGFMGGSVVLTFKLKGVLYAVLMLVPHHIIMVCLILFYSSMMLHFSYKLMRGTYNGESINLQTFIKKIGVLFVSALVICFIASLLEVYVSPLILKLVL